MKIAYVIDDSVEVPPKNGVTSRFFEVVRRLCRDEQAKCYIGDRGATNLTRLRSEGVRGFIFPHNWLYGEGSALRDLMHSERVDIVHATNAHSLSVSYAIRLADELGARLVVDMHDLESELADEPEQARHLDDSQVTLANIVDCSCVMSNKNLNSLLSMGVGRSKLFYSPNGMNRTDHPHLRGGPVAVLLGNFFYPPNLQAARFTAEKLAPTVNVLNARFRLLGPCHPGLAAELASESVTVEGPIDDLTESLCSATLGIAPIATGSGMKTKILDYASFSLPVVCTRLASEGYPDAPGLIVCHSDEELIDAVRYLLSNTDLARALGVRLRNSLLPEFSWDLIVKKLRDMYLSLDDGPLPQRPQATLAPDGATWLLGRRFPAPTHLQEERYRILANQAVRALHIIN